MLTNALIQQRLLRNERLSGLDGCMSRFFEPLQVLENEDEDENGSAFSSRRLVVHRDAMRTEEGSGDILFPGAVMATDIPCQRVGFNRYGDFIEFLEILDPWSLDLSRGAVALPMLLDHNMYEFRAVIGEWTNIRPETGTDGVSRLIGDGRLFNIPDIQFIVDRVKRQSTTFFSVTYTPDEYLDVTEENDETPVLQTLASTLYECSVVGVPADAESHRHIRALDAIKGEY